MQQCDLPSRLQGDHTIEECSVTHSASTGRMHLGSARASKQHTLCLTRGAHFTWFWATELSAVTFLAPASQPLCHCVLFLQDVPLCVSSHVCFPAFGGFLHTSLHCNQTSSWPCSPGADPKRTDAERSHPSNCCRLWNKLSINNAGWKHSKKSHYFTHAHRHTLRCVQRIYYPRAMENILFNSCT